MLLERGALIRECGQFVTDRGGKDCVYAMLVALACHLRGQERWESQHVSDEGLLGSELCELLEQLGGALLEFQSSQSGEKMLADGARLPRRLPCVGFVFCCHSRSATSGSILPSGPTVIRLREILRDGARTHEDLVRQFRSSLTYSGQVSSRHPFGGRNLGQEFGEILPDEFPFEGLGGLLPIALESEEAFWGERRVLRRPKDAIRE